MEAGTLSKDNDENEVIADKVLSYFQCLSSKFEASHFVTK